MNKFILDFPQTSNIVDGDSKEDLELTIKTLREEYKKDRKYFPDIYYFYKDVNAEYYTASKRLPRPNHNQTVYKYYSNKDIYRVIWTSNEGGFQREIIEKD